MTSVYVASSVNAYVGATLMSRATSESNADRAVGLLIDESALGLLKRAQRVHGGL